MWRLSAFVMLAALALPATAAPVYKCTNAQGETYYSGQPCPKSDAAERLRVQRPASSDQAAADDNSRKTLDERIAEADDPVLKAQLELRKKECELARTQLSRYENAPYLIEKQADGTERRLSDEEAEAEKQRLRQLIDSEC